MCPRALAPILLSALSAGCLSLDLDLDLPATGTWGGGSMGFGGATQKGGTSYGIVHLTHNDRVYFVMLIEGANGGRVLSGTGASGEFRKATGTATWAVRTRTGRTGQAVIDGQVFQLESGAVFLVSARGPEIGITQVRADLDAFNAGNWSVDDRLRRLGETDERVAAFLKQCETPK